MASEKQSWEDIEASKDSELLSLKLQLSTAVELLISRIDTAMVMFDEDKSWQSDDDWEECLKIINFLRTVKGRDFYIGQRIQLENYLESVNQ